MSGEEHIRSYRGCKLGQQSVWLKDISRCSQSIDSKVHVCIVTL